MAMRIINSIFKNMYSSVVLITITLFTTVNAQESQKSTNVDPGETLWSTRPPTKGERPQDITSMPAVGKDHLYIGTVRGFFALDKKNGEVLWKFKKKGFAHPFYSSPLIVRNRVYTGSNDPGRIYCFNKNNGDVIWSYKTNADVPSSPAYHQERIFVGSEDGFVYCFDPKTGKKHWQTRMGGSIFATPAISDQSLIAGNAKKWYCLNTKNGNVRWTFELSSQAGSACIYNGNVFISGAKGSNSKVFCLNLTSGNQKWVFEQIRAVRRTPVVDSSGLYVGGMTKHPSESSPNGFLFKLDPESGKVTWKQKMPLFSIVSTTRYDMAALSKNNLYFNGVEDDKTVLYSYNKKNGKRNWKKVLGPPTDLRPVLEDGRLYLGIDEKVYCIQTEAKKNVDWPVFRGNNQRTGTPHRKE